MVEQSLVCESCRMCLPIHCFLIDVEGSRHVTCAFCIALLEDDDE